MAWLIFVFGSDHFLGVVWTLTPSRSGPAWQSHEGATLCGIRLFPHGGFGSRCDALLSRRVEKL